MPTRVNADVAAFQRADRTTIVAAGFLPDLHPVVATFAGAVCATLPAAIIPANAPTVCVTNVCPLCSTLGATVTSATISAVRAAI